MRKEGARLLRHSPWPEDEETRRRGRRREEGEVAPPCRRAVAVAVAGFRGPKGLGSSGREGENEEDEEMGGGLSGFFEEGRRKGVFG